MTLDELLKQNALWLEQAKKRRVFDRVDEKAAKFPEEQRERRKAQIETRIGELARRREDAIAAFDRAIASEKAELDALRPQKSTAANPDSTKPATGAGKKSKKRRS